MNRGWGENKEKVPKKKKKEAALLPIIKNRTRRRK
jgi:hypothetical protein